MACHAIDARCDHDDAPSRRDLASDALRRLRLIEAGGQELPNRRGIDWLGRQMCGHRGRRQEGRQVADGVAPALVELFGGQDQV